MRRLGSSLAGALRRLAGRAQPSSTAAVATAASLSASVLAKHRAEAQRALVMENVRAMRKTFGMEGPGA